jgi:hypothetical protein
MGGVGLHTGAHMQLDKQEQAFLARRARLIGAWPYAGGFLLTTLIGFAAFLFWRVPTLANPHAVLSRLETNSIPESTMMISAVLLPIVFLVCVILAASIVLFTFAQLSNERKYLKIIQNMTEAASRQEQVQSAPDRGAQQCIAADRREDAPPAER